MTLRVEKSLKIVLQTFKGHSNFHSNVGTKVMQYLGAPELHSCTMCNLIRLLIEYTHAL